LLFLPRPPAEEAEPMPSDDDTAAVAALAEEIARYLAQNQGASDTVDGITRWWITRARLLETRSMVEKALQQLEADGRIQPTRTASGDVVYGLPVGSAAPAAAEPPRDADGDAGEP
jgi:hypothetical protein